MWCGFNTIGVKFKWVIPLFFRVLLRRNGDELDWSKKFLKASGEV